MSLTTDKDHPDLGRGADQGQVPQNKVYLVLSDEEKAKGFVRPVRISYIHKGRLYDKGIEILEKPELIGDKEYVAIAAVLLNEDGSRKGGSYITQAELDQHKKTGGYIGGCGTVTTMHQSIAETYAANPHFYGNTYCVTCRRHLPVSEFLWDGTNEKVGS